MPDYVWKALLVLTGTVLIGLTLSAIRHTRSPAGRFALHGIAGLSALITANTVTAVFGAGVAVNAVTLSLSGLLGIPGVGLLYILRYAVLGA